MEHRSAADDAPLTAKEQALWLFQQYAPESGAFNVPFALRSTDRFRWWPLNTALRHLAYRHPALRTLFPSTDGVPRRVQLAADDPRARIPLLVHASTAARLEHELSAFAAAPFDLPTEVPIRVGQFVTDSADVLCVVVHHLVYDSRSANVLRRELLQLYQSLSTTSQIPVALADPVPAVPRDGDGAAARAYWREQLAEVPVSRGELRIGRSGPRQPTFPGTEMSLALAQPTRDAIDALCQRLGVTANILMLAAYTALLSRHGMGRDVVVGVPVDGRGARPHAAVGYYMNIIALGRTVDDDTTFRELVRACRDQFLGGLLHANISIDEVLPGSYEQADPGRAPLFRHIFNYIADLPGEVTADPATGGAAQTHPVHMRHSRLDLTMVVLRLDNALVCNAIYATDVFEADEMRALLNRYALLFEACARDPDVLIRDLPLWTDEDRRVVAVGNDNTGQRPAPSVVRAVVDRAVATPDAPAVVEPEGTVSYAALVQAAAGLAESLAERGIDDGDTVGVAGMRGSGFLAAALAAWSRGAAVLAVDPGDPRAEAELTAAGVRVLIGPGWPPGDRQVVGWPDPLAEPGVPSADRLADPSPSATAWLTRSRDGERLIRISQDGQATVVADLSDRLRLGAGDTHLWLTEPTHDVALAEPWPALTRGARVVLAAPAARDDPSRLVGVARAGDTVLSLGPLVLARFLDAVGRAPLPGRVRVVCTGEPAPDRLIAQAAEAGLCVIQARCLPETSGPYLVSTLDGSGATAEATPIRLVSNMRARIVDPDGLAQPPGVRGELWLTGPAVATGSAEESSAGGSRLHRDESGQWSVHTGLTAHWRFDGSIHVDERHSPGLAARMQVVSALREHPRVRWAVPDETDDIVYVECRGSRGSMPDLTGYLTRQRPDGGAGIEVRVMQRLPTRDQGVVDLAALTTMPAVQGAPVESRASLPAATSAQRPFDPTPAGADAAPPTATLVADLIQVWRRLLADPVLSQDDDFFLNGGNSLLAARVVAYVKKSTGARLSLRTVFRSPTPARLAREVADLLDR